VLASCGVNRLHGGHLQHAGSSFEHQYSVQKSAAGRLRYQTLQELGRAAKGCKEKQQLNTDCLMLSTTCHKYFQFMFVMSIIYFQQF
jgi:hypothetical protein